MASRDGQELDLLMAELEDRAERLSLLNRIAIATSRSLDLAEVAETIYREIAGIVKADVFFIAAYYPQTEELDYLVKVDEGIREPRERRKVIPSLSQWVITNKKPLLISDLWKEKERYPIHLWGTGKLPRSCLGVPMMIGDEVVGVLSIQSYRPNVYTKRDVELLSTIASQAAIAIRNAILHQEEKKRADQLALINEVSRQIAATLEPQRLFSKVVEVIRERFGYYSVALFLVEGEYAVLKAVSGGYAHLIKGEYRQHLSQGIIGWAITHNETVLCNDVQKDPRYIPGPVPEGVTRSELCVPIRSRSRVIGALDVQSTEAGAFDRLDAVAMETLASQIAVALHNARLYKRLKETSDLLFIAANSIQDEAMVIRPDYIIMDANDRILEHLRLSRKEVIGRPCYEVLRGRDSPCPKEKRVCCIRWVMEEKKPVRLTRLEEYGGDEKYFLDVTASPIFNENGEITHIVVIRHDITARVKLQERLETIRRLGRELIMAADEDEIIEAVLDAAETVLEYNAVAFLWVDEEKNELYLKALRGYPMPENPVRLPLDGDKGITVAVVRSDVPDVTKDPRFVKGHPTLRTRSEMDVPVKVRGKVIGVINVEDERVDAFTEDDLLLLMALADQASIAFENAQLRKDLQRKVAELESLFQASTALASTLDLERLLDEILSAAVEIIPGAEKGSILLVDEQTGELAIRCLKGYTDSRIKEVRFPKTEGYSAKAMREGKPLLIPDARKDPEIRYDGDIEEMRAIRSAIVAPLQAKDRIIGVVSLDNASRTEAFTEDDLRLLSVFASHAAAAIENARLTEALARSESHYRLLAESNLAGVYLIQDGLFRYVNPALAAMFGYTVGEIVDHLGPLDLAAPEDRPVVAENIHRRLGREMESVHYRFRGLRKDGLIIHCEALGTTIDYRGRPAILGTILDITERVRAEEETRRRARELEALNRLAEALATTLELGKMAELAGNVLMEITGADAVGFHIFEGEKGRGFAISRTTGFRPLSISLTSEQAKALQMMPDTPFFLEDLSIVPHIPDFVQARGFTCGSFLPIHLRGKKAGFVSLFYLQPHTCTEEEMNLLEAIAGQLSLALEKALLYREVVQARQEWESSFNAITDGMFIVDRDFTILRANEALAQRLGTSPQELIGKKCYKLVHGTDAPPPWCLYSAALKEGRPVSMEMEEPNLKGIFLWSVYPILNGEGKTVASSHLLRDITREKEIQERLFQAEKLASLGQLISGVAHELNNPLTSVVGYAQLLALDPSIPERVRDDLVRIQEQARRASNIVQNLLDFARRRPPRRELTNINELLQKTINLRLYELRVENINVITHFDPELPWTMVDPNQIQQVFLNIIVNAEQAMSEAHGKGTLTMRTSLADDGYIRIEISDDGPGIPEEHLSHIFDPFFTTKEKGTGLGLAIAYSFVAEHKGRIWARNNTPLPGVTFYIELPVEREKVVTWREEALGKREEVERRPGKHILVVEDEEAIAELLRRILEEDGHVVEVVTGAETALELLRAKPFDLVITDIKMPGIGGRGLYKKVREINEKLAHRIVFVTGDVLEPSTQAFLASTGNPFLTKPFNVERVKELTRGLLAKEDDASSAP